MVLGQSCKINALGELITITKINAIQNLNENMAKRQHSLIFKTRFHLSNKINKLIWIDSILATIIKAQKTVNCH